MSLSLRLLAQVSQVCWYVSNACVQFSFCSIISAAIIAMGSVTSLARTGRITHGGSGDRVDQRFTTEFFGSEDKKKEFRRYDEDVNANANVL